MMQNPHAVRQAADQYIAPAPADYQQNLRLYEALYMEAKNLGVLPAKLSMEVIAAKTGRVRLFAQITIPKELQAQSL
ncbi:MAG: hypothetical protein AAF730_08655 [Bacteroidota bacterium]